MAKFRKWFKELWCRLSGDHIYATINLQTQWDECNMMYTFKNRCVRCGKIDEWEIPAENLLPKKPSMYVFVEDKEDGKES